jgi:hypothetical protein
MSDPFQSRENVEFLHSYLKKNGMDVEQYKLIDLASRIAEANPTSYNYPSKHRVERLNRAMINTVTTNIHKLGSYVKSNNTNTNTNGNGNGMMMRSTKGTGSIIGSDHAAPTNFKLVEKIIILNAADRDWADTQQNAYDFPIKFNPDSNYKGLSLSDGHLNNCVSVEPIALFIPKVPIIPDIDNSPYLVLETNTESSNEVSSTQKLLNGTNVAMTISNTDSNNYNTYNNFAKTTLNTDVPLAKLSKLHIKVKNASGVILNSDADIIYKHLGTTAPANLKWNTVSNWHFHMDPLPVLNNSSNYNFDFYSTDLNMRYSDDLNEKLIEIQTALVAAPGDATLLANQTLVNALISIKASSDGTEIPVSKMTMFTIPGTFTTYNLNWFSLRETNATSASLIIKAVEKVSI